MEKIYSPLYTENNEPEIIRLRRIIVNISLQLRGIETEDLTRAEKNIMEILKKYENT